MAIQKLQLYTAATPNGQKVHNFAEELRAVYGPDVFDFEYHMVSLGKNEQKQDWFLKINPNGRIPALVDPNNSNFAVFETAAILLYLEKKYDPDHKFSWPSSDPQAENYRSEVLQWIFFVHGGIGPMQGQSNHFSRYAPEDIPYGKQRYLNETIRLYAVLEQRLSENGGREWLVGEGKGKYSLADVNAYPWVQWYKWAGLKESDVGPNVHAWLKRNLDRKAVKKGMYAPEGKHDRPSSSSHQQTATRRLSLLDKILDPEFETKYAAEADAHAKQNSAWIQQGMKSDAEKHGK